MRKWRNEEMVRASRIANERKRAIFCRLLPVGCISCGFCSLFIFAISSELQELLLYDLRI